MQFKEITSSSQGYIILDGMSSTRIDKNILKDLESMPVVFEKNDGFWKKIQVYRYG